MVSTIEKERIFISNYPHTEVLSMCGFGFYTPMYASSHLRRACLYIDNKRRRTSLEVQRRFIHFEVYSLNCAYFISSSISSTKVSNRCSASSIGFAVAISTPAPRSRSMGGLEQPPLRKFT